MVKRQKLLEDNNEGLLLDADEYGFETQDKCDIKCTKLLLAKSNALRKEVKKNENIILELNNQRFEEILCFKL